MDLSFFRQTWEMMRQQRLFTSIYILGTALAVAMVTGYVIIFYINIFPIYPEYNRPETIRIFYASCTHNGQGDAVANLSLDAVETLRKLENKELMTAVFCDRYAVQEAISVDLMFHTEIQRKLVDADFFKFFDFDFVEGSPITQGQFDRGEHVAVITDKFANEMFGNSAQAIGKDFYIDYNTYRVIGVVRSPSTLTIDSFAHVYLPYTTDANWNKQTADFDWNGMYKVFLTSKNYKKLGAELEDLTADINSSRKPEEGVVKIVSFIEPAYQVYIRGYEINSFNFANIPWWYGLKKIGLVVLVLLLVPALNLSGIIASRMDSRIAEIGVRKSFGATSGRLLMRIMTENLVLTCIGGVVGLIVCWIALYLSADWIFTAIGQLDSGSGHYAKSTIFPSLMFFAPEVFVSAFIVCLVLNVASAIIPAWRSLRRPIVHSITSDIGNRRRQNIWIFIELVIVTIVTWVVLDKAIFMVVSSKIPLGYDADRLAILKFNTLPERAPNYSNEAADSASVIAAFNTIKEKLTDIKGIESFTYTGPWGLINEQKIVLQADFNSHHADEKTNTLVPRVNYYPNENFFRTYGIKLSGYAPDPDTITPLMSSYPCNDDSTMHWLRGLVLTRELAEHMFPGENPVGQEWSNIPNRGLFYTFNNDNHFFRRYPMGINPDDPTICENVTFRVSSVIENVRYQTNMPSWSVIFMPQRKPDIPSTDFNIVVRLRPDYSPEQFVREVLADRRSFNIGNYYLEGAKTYITFIRGTEDGFSIKPQQNMALLLAVFFLINIILGIIGTFAVQAQKRVVEMGIRRSFGANKSDIISMIVKENLVLVTLAFLIGDFLYLQYALKCGLEYGPNSTIGIQIDMWLWKFWPRFLLESGIIYLLLGLSAVIGTLIPAIRAANINPVDALHDD